LEVEVALDGMEGVASMARMRGRRMDQTEVASERAVDVVENESEKEVVVVVVEEEEDVRGHDRGHCEGVASCCASGNPDKDVGVAQLKSWRCEIGLDRS
jgi:hypothetical protein